MKKSKILLITIGSIISFILIIAMIIVMIITVVIFVYAKKYSQEYSSGDYSAESYLSKAAGLSGLNLDSGSIIKFKDTKGGFFGEGDVVLEIQYSHDDYINIEESISSQEHWEKLPMDEKLEERIYGLGFEIPQKGYFLFYDRHSEAVSHYDYEEMLNRYSVDFSMFILDKEAKKIVYIEKDT